MLFHAEKGGELSGGRAGSEHPDQKKNSTNKENQREVCTGKTSLQKADKQSWVFPIRKPK